MRATWTASRSTPPATLWTWSSAPIRGLSTEVPVGRRNGPHQASVISCDTIVTVPEAALGPQIGYLVPTQEAALTNAVHAAFDLD